MAQFGAVLRAIAKLHEEGRVVVVRVKDRIRQPSSGGWRDVMINLYVASDPDRHVCEIQVAHAKMLTARVGLDGHAIYGKQRNASELEGAAFPPGWSASLPESFYTQLREGHAARQKQSAKLQVRRRADTCSRR